MAEVGSAGEDIFWENELWGLTNSDHSAGSDGNQLQMMDMVTTNTTAAASAPTTNNNSNKNNNFPVPSRKVQMAAPQPPQPSGKRKKTNGKLPMSSGGDQPGNGDEAPAGGIGGGKGGELEHELHIWTERERRKKMRSMFSNLQDLLPQLPAKVDKSTIVDEAVNYIKTLQQTLQKLQKQKLEVLQGLTTMAAHDPHRSVAGAMDSGSREAFLADFQGFPSSSNQEMIPTTTMGTAHSSPVLGVARSRSTAFRTWSAPNMVLNVCGEKAHINICCPKKIGLFSAICFFLEKHKLQVLSAHVSTDQFRSMYMIQAHATGSADQYAEGGLSFEDVFQMATGEILMYISSN